jgi:hypothetical protein
MGLSDFIPIPEFSRDDADVNIWVLQNKVSYTEEVLDPWFKSTTPRTLGTGNVFQSDYTSSSLGCTEQYQFCNQTSCTELSNLDHINTESISILNYNKAQKATFNLLWAISTVTSMDYLLFMLAESLLLAKGHLFGEHMLSTTLPDTQWEQEVRNLFNVTLTLLHSMLQGHANSPDTQITSNTSYHQYLVRENSTEAQYICHNQKTATAGYYAFNVFGLAFILATGLVVIIVSNTVPRVVTALRNNSESQELSRIRETAWHIDEILHIDSIALDAYNIGPWNQEHQVPIPLVENGEFTVPWIRRKAEVTDDSSSLLGP